ncbi:MAG: hypothetical protein AB7F59_06965 [Bdellovibrionales bacterium]
MRLYLSKFILLGFAWILMAQNAAGQSSMDVSLPTLFPEAFENTSKDLDVLFAPWKNQILLGREIELSEVPLSNVMEYFDFRHINFAKIVQQYGDPQRMLEFITEKYLDHYIQNPEAFEALPQEIKLQLTAGLNLENVLESSQSGAKTKIITRQTVNSIPTGLLDPQGQPIQKEVIRLDSLPLTSANQKLPESLLAVEKSQQWQILYRRWQNLDIATRLRVAEPQYLTPRKKAQLYIELLHRQTIPLRADIPIPLDFLKNLIWRVESSILEFKDSEQSRTKDAAEFVRNVQTFSKLTGVYNAIWNPLNQTRFHSSFHYHLSFPTPSQDLEKQVMKLNQLLVLRSLHLGFPSVLREYAPQENWGYGSFKPDTSVKGLLRLVDAHRVEIRHHLEDPVTELRFILYYLTLPKKEALKKMDILLVQLATPTILEILESAPSAHSFLLDILYLQNISSLTEQQIKILFRTAPISQIENFFDKNPESFLESDLSQPEFTRLLSVRQKHPLVLKNLARHPEFELLMGQLAQVNFDYIVKNHFNELARQFGSSKFVNEEQASKNYLELWKFVIARSHVVGLHEALFKSVSHLPLDKQIRAFVVLIGAEGMHAVNSPVVLKFRAALLNEPKYMQLFNNYTRSINTRDFYTSLLNEALQKPHLKEWASQQKAALEAKFGPSSTTRLSCSRYLGGF